MGRKLFAVASWDTDVPEMKDEQNLTKQSKLKKTKRNLLKIQKQKQTDVENDPIDNSIIQSDDCFKVSFKNKKNKKHKRESCVINELQSTKEANEHDILKISNRSTRETTSKFEKPVETTSDKLSTIPKQKKGKKSVIAIESMIDSNMSEKLTGVKQEKIKKQKVSAKTQNIKTFENETSKHVLENTNTKPKKLNKTIESDGNQLSTSSSEVQKYNNIVCSEVTKNKKLKNNVDEISTLNHDVMNNAKSKKNKKLKAFTDEKSLHNTENTADERSNENKHTELKVFIKSAINNKSQKNKKKKVRFLETSETFGINEVKNGESTLQKINIDIKNNKKKNNNFNKINDELQDLNTGKKSKKIKKSNITSNLNSNDDEIMDFESVTKSLKKNNKRKIETVTQKEINIMEGGSLIIQNKSDNKENRKKRKTDKILNENSGNINFYETGIVNTDSNINSKSAKKGIINLTDTSNTVNSNKNGSKKMKLNKNHSEAENFPSNKSDKKNMKKNKTKSINSINHNQIPEEIHNEDKKNKISNKSLLKLKAKPKILNVRNTNMKNKIKNLLENDKLSSTLNSTKQVEVVTKANNKAAKKAKPLRERMLEKLKGARLRYLNELMYTKESKDTHQMFKEDPSSFTTYHEGYQQQVKKWPLNPLDFIIEDIAKLPKSYKIADLGCGDARLANSVPHEVHSFDFIAVNSTVIACDMAHTSLLTSQVDVAVFCLSLMGTNLKDYFIEANRILKMKGTLKIAEVESRLENVEKFISDIRKYGFSLSKKDLKNNFFYFLDFTKENDIKKRNKLPEIRLSPCLYKKR